jgi:DNA-binding phage protein
MAEPVPAYDPIKPDIAPSSICENIYVRAYAEPELPRGHGAPELWEPRTRPDSWFDGEFIVIDTETVEHRLTFGAYERFHRRKLIERAVFCRDDLAAVDPKGFAILCAICRRLDVRLYLLANVFSSHIWRLRKKGGTFAFFNASYDLSRLASSWRPAVATPRRGARFVNGFEFIRRFTTAKDRHGKPLVGADGRLQTRVVEAPFVRIRRDDRHHVRYDMAAANVLDLATLTHTLTDQTYSLERACEAFGAPFADRPGEHDGTIAEANVEGCLYDVGRTSALLFAAGREYDRHPIDLPTWRAQSGASLAKAYLRAFGVAPRSIVQPDFSKEHQGYAATTYFGGRVESGIVGESMPCAYIDALSMYPSILSLLNLWFDQVIPARLEPEDLDPMQVQELLDELHGDPRRLLAPATWPKLAFFALVEPHGAHLPARPTIPSPYVSRRAMVAQDAQRIFDEQSAAQEPYWRALDECGGKIIPDMVFDRKRKRWQRAGEFVDVPPKFMGANQRRSATGRVDGNLDRIAQIIRNCAGDENLTTSVVLDFFREHDRPSLLLARKLAVAEIPEDQGDPTSHRLVTIGPVTSQEPLWYAGPDLAAAAISGSGRPRIVRAWRLRPEGLQSTLQPAAIRNDDWIDPRVTNPYQRLVELRKRKSGNKLDDELRATGYKVIANSGAYGVFVETTPEDVDPDATRPPSRVAVWGLHAFQARVERPERHSPLCSFPIAALVTAGARLLLAVAERLVRDAGGEVAYCDTDSLIIVATEDGGFAPCTNGPYRLSDGSRAVRALSWSEVDRILDDLAALNVYDRSIITGSSFKLEDENFEDDGRRRQLWFYGSREKSYGLYVLNNDAKPVLVKQSAHTIGQYRSPYSRDRQRRWVAEAWEYTIRAYRGMQVEEPPWFDWPATSQVTLTTRNLMKHYAKTSNPFDFLAVAQLAYPGMLRCCEAPRPSCPLYEDRERWAEQPWRCLSCGAPIDPYLADTEQPIFKTYRRVVANLAQSVELKRLCADGSEPTPRTMRGLTIPRPVRVVSIEHIGKEVIVDPTDANEELTAQMLSETSVTEYHDAAQALDALRRQIREHGIRAVSREAAVSRRHLQEFLDGSTEPHSETISKVKAALRKIRTC